MPPHVPRACYMFCVPGGPFSSRQGRNRSAVPSGFPSPALSLRRFVGAGRLEPLPAGGPGSGRVGALVLQIADVASGLPPRPRSPLFLGWALLGEHGRAFQGARRVILRRLEDYDLGGGLALSFPRCTCGAAGSAARGRGLRASTQPTPWVRAQGALARRGSRRLSPFQNSCISGTA